jgi:hypothetical protein
MFISNKKNDGKDSKCKGVTCPAGQRCDETTGKCTEKGCDPGTVLNPQTNICTCTTESCSKLGSLFRCVGNVCTEDKPNPPGDLCKDKKCDNGLICDPKTGVCSCVEGKTCQMPFKCATPTGPCARRTCGEGCNPPFVCNNGYCYVQPTCDPGTVYVPSKVKCEVPVTCLPSLCEERDPDTNTCHFVGCQGIEDLTAATGDNGTPYCDTGYTPGQQIMGFTGWHPMVCRKDGKLKDKGVVEVLYARNSDQKQRCIDVGGTPYLYSSEFGSGFFTDSYLCVMKGDAKSPRLVTDFYMFHTPDIKGDCAVAGLTAANGWTTVMDNQDPADFRKSYGGDYVRACVRRKV